MAWRGSKPLLAVATVLLLGGAAIPATSSPDATPSFHTAENTQGGEDGATASTSGFDIDYVGQLGTGVCVSPSLEQPTTCQHATRASNVHRLFPINGTLDRAHLRLDWDPESPATEYLNLEVRLDEDTGRYVGGAPPLDITFHDDEAEYLDIWVWWNPPASPAKLLVDQEFEVTGTVEMT